MSHSAASVRARLLAKAKSANQDFSLVLTRYGLERLLYRLSVSSSKDNFLLKVNTTGMRLSSGGLPIDCI